MGLFDSRFSFVPAVDSFAGRYFDEPAIRQWIVSRGIPNDVYDDFYLSELGGYVLSPEAGGKDCTFLERAALIAQLTRKAGATLPFLSDLLTNALISTMRSLSRHEISDYLRANSGRFLLSQAFSEDTAGSDASAVVTSISLDEGAILLDGCKTFVANGQFAPHLLVLSRDSVFGRDDGGLSLWVAPIDALGVSTYPLNSIGQEMLAPARVVFDHVMLEPDWRIQTEGKLNIMLKHQYALGRILVCASSLGLARAAMDDAIAHARTHMVKGMSLASLPQIQEKIASMEVKLRAMEMLVQDAAEAVGGSDADTLYLNCALMKYRVPALATEVSSDALQILGGRGYTDQARVGRIWCDCRGNQIAQGTDEVVMHAAAKFLIKLAEKS